MDRYNGINSQRMTKSQKQLIEELTLLYTDGKIDIQEFCNRISSVRSGHKPDSDFLISYEQQPGPALQLNFPKISGGFINTNPNHKH